MLLISDKYVYCSPTRDQSCCMGNLELFVLYTLAFLEGHENLVSRFVMGIIGVIIWLIRVINQHTSPPDPPSWGNLQSSDVVPWGTQFIRSFFWVERNTSIREY